MLRHLLGLEPSLALIGVDLSEGMLRVARREHPGVPLIRGDLVDLPLADGELAAVLAWYSLIHLPDADLPAALTELRRVTRPGGALLVGMQAGTGVRPIERPYGHDVRLTAFLHDTARVAADLVTAGFSLDAVLTRAPRDAETHAQGFVLATAR